MQTSRLTEEVADIFANHMSYNLHMAVNIQVHARRHIHAFSSSTVFAPSSRCQAGKYAEALKSYSRAIDNLKMFAGEDARPESRNHSRIKLRICAVRMRQKAVQYCAKTLRSVVLLEISGCLPAEIVTTSEFSHVPLEAEGSAEDPGGLDLFADCTFDRIGDGGASLFVPSLTKYLFCLGMPGIASPSPYGRCARKPYK